MATQWGGSSGRGVQDVEVVAVAVHHRHGTGRGPKRRGRVPRGVQGSFGPFARHDVRSPVDHRRRALVQPVELVGHRPHTGWGVVGGDLGNEVADRLAGGVDIGHGVEGPVPVEPLQQQGARLGIAVHQLDQRHEPRPASSASRSPSVPATSAWILSTSARPCSERTGQTTERNPNIGSPVRFQRPALGQRSGAAGQSVHPRHPLAGAVDVPVLASGNREEIRHVSTLTDQLL